jgi:hypothetical protein
MSRRQQTDGELLDRAERQYDANTRAIVSFMAEEIYYPHLLMEASRQWRAREPEIAWTLGPLAAVTVPCGCHSGCDWCAGAKWLTERCKQAKTEAGE